MHGTGCGECPGCHTTLAGTHADVRLVVPEGLSIGVNEMRALVLRAASTPSGGRWQVVIIEDADRLTEAAGNALLKAVEEPPPRTVFLLCAPSTHPDDISVTIRSRCRVVPLRQPAAERWPRCWSAGTGSLPTWPAGRPPPRRAMWGGLGELARDPQARARREAVLAVPRRGAGDGTRCRRYRPGCGRRRPGSRRSTEGPGTTPEVTGDPGQRDALDRALVDLAAFYRDALTMALGAPVSPVHSDTAELAEAGARSWQAEGALRRLEAVLTCRAAIEANVKPRIAVEAMMLALWKG